MFKGLGTRRAKENALNNPGEYNLITKNIQCTHMQKVWKQMAPGASCKRAASATKAAPVRKNKKGKNKDKGRFESHDLVGMSNTTLESGD